MVDEGWATWLSSEFLWIFSYNVNLLPIENYEPSMHCFTTQDGP